MQTTAQAQIFAEAVKRESKIADNWDYDWGFLRTKPKVELPPDFDVNKPASAASGDPVLAAAAGFDMGSLITDPPQRASADVRKRYTAMLDTTRPPMAATYGGTGVKFPEQTKRTEEFASWKASMKTMPKATTHRQEAVRHMRDSLTRKDMESTYVAGTDAADTLKGQEMLAVIERKLSSPTKKYELPKSTSQEVGFLVAKGHDLETFRRFQNHGKKSVKFT